MTHDNTIAEVLSQEVLNKRKQVLALLMIKKALGQQQIEDGNELLKYPKEMLIDILGLQLLSIALQENISQL